MTSDPSNSNESVVSCAPVRLFTPPPVPTVALTVLVSTVKMNSPVKNPNTSIVAVPANESSSPSRSTGALASASDQSSATASTGVPPTPSLYAPDAELNLNEPPVTASVRPSTPSSDALTPEATTPIQRRSSVAGAVGSGGESAATESVPAETLRCTLSVGPTVTGLVIVSSSVESVAPVSSAPATPSRSTSTERLE